ncbi:MAG TPA: POTRA domain-containing protein, partial [Nitrospirota bacterium]
MYFLRLVAAAACFLSFALPARSAPPDFSGATITRIILKDALGRPLGRPDQLAELIGLQPGDGFSGPAVRDGIKMLYLKGTFRDIRVEAFPENAGVRLEYTFIPVTTVRKVRVHGNRALPASAVKEVFANIEGKELRAGRLSGFEADIVALYQAAGYYNAGIAFRTEAGAKPYVVDLHVDIREGRPTLIKEIAFVGNAVFKEKELLAVMKSRVGRPLERDLLLDTDMEALLRKYTDAGYPAAKPGPVTMSFRDNRAYVRILCSEGPRVAVRFSGNREFSTKKLNKALLIWSDHDISDAVIDSSLDK